MSGGPTLDLERELLEGLPAGSVVAGVDEVGRGSLAGPVSVAIALVDASTGDIPAGLRDSKRMTPAARQRMVPLVRQWATGIAVGHAGPEIVDEVGIVAALREAARDALSRLERTPDLVVLDGKHDWWSEGSLFDEDACLPRVPVHMRIGGDDACAAIAAASVVAKVERDAVMVSLDREYPGYDWARNKGYSAPAHIAGLAELGVSPQHRTSWNLPGIGRREVT
ncbi:MAG: ribonuclease HII [Actinomycetaceae bacterium]|nr:ribonuclease HII [Actinomycetaceae bacterium]